MAWDASQHREIKENFRDVLKMPEKGILMFLIVIKYIKTQAFIVLITFLPCPTVWHTISVLDVKY